MKLIGIVKEIKEDSSEVIILDSIRLMHTFRVTDDINKKELVYCKDKLNVNDVIYCHIDTVGPAFRVESVSKARKKDKER